MVMIRPPAAASRRIRRKPWSSCLSWSRLPLEELLRFRGGRGSPFPGDIGRGMFVQRPSRAAPSIT